MSVTFSPEAARALEALAKRKGRSMADVIRDAIAMEQWLEEARQKGERILIEREGTLREIVWR